VEQVGGQSVGIPEAGQAFGSLEERPSCRLRGGQGSIPGLNR
jgi:hypothetical protein